MKVTMRVMAVDYLDSSKMQPLRIRKINLEKNSRRWTVMAEDSLILQNSQRTLSRNGSDLGMTDGQKTL